MMIRIVMMNAKSALGNMHGNHGWCVSPMLMSSLKCLQATQWLSTSAPKSDIDSAAKFIGAGKDFC